MRYSSGLHLGGDPPTPKERISFWFTQLLVRLEVLLAEVEVTEVLALVEVTDLTWLTSVPHADVLPIGLVQPKTGFPIHGLQS